MRAQGHTYTQQQQQQQQPAHIHAAEEDSKTKRYHNATRES